MTDHPTDPDPIPDDGGAWADESTSDDARWFRAAVDPVLDARPVSDDWAAVRSRVTGAGPTVVPLSSTVARRRPPRAWLFAAAAAIATVAGFAGALAVIGPDDDTVTSGGPPEVTVPSGFYVPTDLPDGWEVSSFYEVVDGSRYDRCPCESGAWKTDGRLVQAHRMRLDPAAPRGDLVEGNTYFEGVEPWSSGGVDGHTGIDPSTQGRTYSWYAGDQMTWVTVDAPTPFDLGAAVEVWAEGDLIDPAGFERIDRARVDGDLAGLVEVYGSFWNPTTSAHVPFVLSPDPYGRVTVAAAQGEAPSWRVGAIPFVQDQERPTGYSAAWPGAVLAIGGSRHEGAMGDDVTDDDLLALLRSFRPATADEWAAFVDDLPTEGRSPNELETTRNALVRERFSDLLIDAADLGSGDEVSTDLFEPDGPRPDDGRPPVADDDGVDGGDEGRPVSIVPSPEPPTEAPTPTVPSLQPDLPYDFEHVIFDVRWGEVPAGRLAPGQPFTLVVTLTNPTDRPLQVSPCFPATATWDNGRSSADPPATGGGSYEVPCDRTEPDTLAPGEVRTIVPPDAPGGFRFTAPTLQEMGGVVPSGMILAEIDFGPDPQRTVAMTYFLSGEGGG